MSAMLHPTRIITAKLSLPERPTMVLTAAARAAAPRATSTVGSTKIAPTTTPAADDVGEAQGPEPLLAKANEGPE